MSRPAASTPPILAKLARGGRGWRGVDQYATSKPGARILSTIFASPDARGRAREFAQIRALRPGLQRALDHWSLSASSGVGRLSDDQWKTAAAEFMRSLGYPADTPLQLVRHQDTGHDHVHLVVSRISLGGAVHDDAHLARRAPAAAAAAAVRLGLRPEPPRPEPPARETDSSVRARRRAQRRGTPAPRPVDLAVAARQALAQAFTWEQLQARLAERGVEAEQVVQSTGRVQGWRLRQAGAQEWLSASQVSRDLSWAKVAQQLDQRQDTLVQTAPRTAPTPPAPAAPERVQPAARPAPIPNSTRRKDMEEAVPQAPSLQPQRPSREEELDRIRAGVAAELAAVPTRVLEAYLDRLHQQEPDKAGAVLLRQLVAALMKLVYRILQVLTAGRLQPPELDATSAVPQGAAWRRQVGAVIERELAVRAAQSPRRPGEVSDAQARARQQLAQLEQRLAGVPRGEALREQAQVRAAQAVGLSAARRAAQDAERRARTLQGQPQAGGLMGALTGQARRQQQELEAAKAAAAAARRAAAEAEGAAGRQGVEEERKLLERLEDWQAGVQMVEARLERLEVEMVAARERELELERLRQQEQERDREGDDDGDGSRRGRPRGG